MRWLLVFGIGICVLVAVGFNVSTKDVNAVTVSTPRPTIKVTQKPVRIEEVYIKNYKSLGSFKTNSKSQRIAASDVFTSSGSKVGAIHAIRVTEPGWIMIGINNEAERFGYVSGRKFRLSTMSTMKDSLVGVGQDGSWGNPYRCYVGVGIYYYGLEYTAIKVGGTVNSCVGFLPASQRIKVTKRKLAKDGRSIDVTFKVDGEYSPDTSFVTNPLSVVSGTAPVTNISSDGYWSGSQAVQATSTTVRVVKNGVYSARIRGDRQSDGCPCSVNFSITELNASKITKVSLVVGDRSIVCTGTANLCLELSVAGRVYNKVFTGSGTCTILLQKKLTKGSKIVAKQGDSAGAYGPINTIIIK